MLKQIQKNSYCSLTCIFNILFYLFYHLISMFFCNLFIKCSKCPQRTRIWLTNIFSLINIVFRKFIYRIVCQVHICVFYVFLCGLLIFFSTKPCKAFISNKCMHFSFIYTHYDDINPHIELFTINNKRIMYIPLY